MSKTFICIMAVQGSGAVIVNDCPVQGVTATAPTGTTSMVVSWTEPTATDALGQQVFYSSRSHQPWQSFTVGQSFQVTYTFSANSGPINTCSFTVTVNRKGNLI